MNQQFHIQETLIKAAFLFSTIYFCFSLTSIGNQSPLFKAVLALGLVCELAAIIFNREIDLLHVVKYLPIMLLIAGTIIYYMFFVKPICDYDYILLFSIAFIAVAGKVKAESLIKIAFCTKLAILVMTVTLSKLGAIESTYLYRDGFIRESIGFNHPNSLALVTLILTIEYMYLYFHKTNLIQFAALGVINYYVYLVTLSRTSFYCAILVSVLFILVKYTTLLHKKVVQGLMISSLVILAVIGVYLPYAFSLNSKFMAELDYMLSNRLFMGKYYLEIYGINLFGTPILQRIPYKYPNGWVQTLLVDSAFLRIIIQFGVIVFLLCGIWVLYRSIRMAKYGHVLELSIVMVIFFYSLFESYTYNIFVFSVTLLLFANEGKQLLTSAPVEVEQEKEPEI